MLVLLFQIGEQRLALDVRRIREVVPFVRLNRPAFMPSWLAGLFIYRGQPVPVIDLHRLMGAGEFPEHLSTRIILVPYGRNGEERLIGLLASRVADIREMQLGANAKALPAESDEPDFGPLLVDGREMIHLVHPERLLPKSYDRQLSLLPGELPR